MLNISENNRTEEITLVTPTSDLFIFRQWDPLDSNTQICTRFCCASAIAGLAEYQWGNLEGYG